jgi:hypothetical protein
VPGWALADISMGLREGTRPLAIGEARLESVLALDSRLRLRQRNRVGGVHGARYFDLAQEMRLFAAGVLGHRGGVAARENAAPMSAAELPTAAIMGW